MSDKDPSRFTSVAKGISTTGIYPQKIRCCFNSLQTKVFCQNFAKNDQKYTKE